MLASLANKITLYFINKDIINSGDKDIYCYSFELLLSFIINCALLLIYSILVGKFIETIFFVVGFMPLRLSAGGYHANTHFKCCLFLMFLYTCFLSIVFFADNNIYYYLNMFICLVSLLVVFVFAPIEDNNKKMSMNEYKHLKLKSRVIMVIDVIIILSSLIFFKYNVFIFSFSLGLSTSTFALILGKLKQSNFRFKNKKGVVSHEKSYEHSR